jgi:ABC-type multidrug transport system fused ATPase/permease subunit
MFLQSPQAETFRFTDLPRALWLFLAGERWQYLFFLGVLLAVMFYTLLPPLLIGMSANFLIDYVKADAGARPAVSQLVTLIAILAGSHAVVSMIRLSSKRVLGGISLNARYRAKVWGFERLLDYSLTWHQQESAGNKAQRILTGSEAVREWTGDMVNSLTSAFAAFVGSLIACMLLHPAFILFFAYYLGVLITIESYFDRRISLLSDNINKSIENASGSFVESASNILAVKALGASSKMTSKVSQREELARTLSYQRLRLSNTKWMCFQIHNSICWGSFLLVIGWMVMSGHLLAGFFLTYAAYFDRLRDAAVDFTDKIQLMIERKSNLGRMMSIFWGTNTQTKGKQDFPVAWDAIHLQEASFRYGDKPAVGPLSITIPRAQVIGIAGHSGSGKSTLIKLLLGLYYMEQGELRIGKTPIAQIRHEDLTANIAVVLQETELFNFTLRDNITMMREVDPALLARACEIACLDDLLARLPGGLETMVGEKGYALSGGERQRVGIARAICRDAPILLMDEATSALDSVTERRVTEALMADYAKGRTLIIVAHRISTLKDTDRVLVFEHGRIVEDGSFAALAADSGGHLGQMYAIQSA